MNGPQKEPLDFSGCTVKLGMVLHSGTGRSVYLEHWPLNKCSNVVEVDYVSGMSMCLCSFVSLMAAVDICCRKATLSLC